MLLPGFREQWRPAVVPFEVGFDEGQIHEGPRLVAMFNAIIAHSIVRMSTIESGMNKAWGTAEHIRLNKVVVVDLVDPIGELVVHLLNICFTLCEPILVMFVQRVMGFPYISHVNINSSSRPMSNTAL
jgi:hypothetical protein